MPQGSKKIGKKDAIAEGTIPIYSSDTSNNGIVGYCNIPPHWVVSKKRPLYLIFGDHTRSFNIADKSFCVADNVRVLIPKGKAMNVRVLLYIIAVWHKAIPILGYARHWTKAKESLLPIPLNNKGEIDYDYMESRIRELEESRIRELEAYLIAAGFEDCTLTQSERDALFSIAAGKKEMRKYRIVDEFTVANSHNILKSDVVFGSGTTPYVTASEGNNSIVSYVSYKPDMIEKGNSIMIGGKTLVVTYQPNNFFSNDSHNLVLTINHEAGRTESAQLFMVAALYKSLSPKYSWGDSISKAKIQSDEVFLPVNADGTIDFEFMDTYISAIKKQCIATLKQEISREHRAYEQAIKLTPAENETEKEKSKIIVLPTYREGCVPLYTLRAACGYFEGSEVPEEEGWIDASGNGFTPDPKHHFAVHAKGDSMQPKIQDGDICVFEWYKAGTRNGEIVLTECSEKDLDYGGKYTIKKYQSEKLQTEAGWQHTKIELISLNNDYDTIELDSENDYRTIGVLKCVINKES